MHEQGLLPREVHFPNGVCARVVNVQRGSSPALILDALGLQASQRVIAVIGAADRLDARFQPRLQQLFSRGIARVAADLGCAIVDGGTLSGVMALIGQGVADRGRRSALLGVAPASKVSYPGGPSVASASDAAPLEPNHTHFVLVAAENWGDEVDTADALAQALAAGRPGVTIVAGGGPIAADEVVLSVRRRWPVIVLSGTGGIAHQLATAARKKRRETALKDARLAEIVADGKLDVFPRNGTPEDLSRIVHRHLRPPEPDQSAEAAWRQFAWLDANAKAERTSFERLQKSVLVFGVWATLLAIAQTLFGPAHPVAPTLQLLLLVVTIGMTILAGVLTRFKASNRWVLLRGGAEAIKAEIFRYRARVKPYDSASADDAGKQLAVQVRNIITRLFATEVSDLGLRAYSGPVPPPMYGAEAEDTGLGLLAADRYVAIRIEDQIRYYQRRSVQLDGKLRLAHWVTFGLGGLATLLASLSAQIWVPLATAAATAVTAYLEYQQVQPTLAKYNQALASLLGVQAWWSALPAGERSEQRNVEDLVGSTEEILAAEQSGWVRQMQDALDKRRAGDTVGGDDGKP